MSSKVVIVGAGQAAGQVVASLRQKKYDGKIVLLGDEEHYPYQRPPLSKKFLAGKIPAERLYVKPPAFYDDPNIDVRLNTRVTNIDPSGKIVTDSNGQEYGYDDLVIATGARVRKLNLPGSGLAGIHYLRNIQDVTALQRDMQSGARLVRVTLGSKSLPLRPATACRSQ
jgi:3-phenylpropionate/trans-cinnamate dioxygenase ferredoxin reductase component